MSDTIYPRQPEALLAAIERAAQASDRDRNADDPRCSVHAFFEDTPVTSLAYEVVNELNALGFEIKPIHPCS